MRLFPQQSLEDGTLTLEHVPPESMGGRGIALTCRECNSFAGHTVDAAAHNRERLLTLGDILAGRGGEFEGPAHVNFQGVSTNAILKMRDNSVSIVVRETTNHPERFRGQMSAIQSEVQAANGGHVEFGVSARVRAPFHRARVGDLRAAFLAAFAQFGYSYAFHPRLASVLEQIARPDEELIDGAWWIAPPILPDPFMGVMTSPFEAVLVRIGRLMIVMPWIFGPETDVYAEARRVFAPNGGPITLDTLYWPTTLVMTIDEYVRENSGHRV
jgi:hypothetical protein